MSRNRHTKTVEVPLRLRSRPHTSRLQSNGAIYAWLSRPGSAGERSNAPGGRRSRSRSNCRALLFFTTIWPELLFGDIEACERHSAELVAYCIEKKVEQFRLYGVVTETCARAQRDPAPEHIEALCAARDAHHRSGARVLDSMILCCLIEALLAIGDVRRAEAALQEADQFVELSGEHLLLSDLRRLEGHIALKQPEADRGEQRPASSNPSRSPTARGPACFELRAVTDLARLRRDTGSPTDLRALLEPILATVEGGKATRDIYKARGLLAEIG